MGWRVARRILGRHSELILAAAFLGMAAYEALEMWVLERPRVAGFSLAVLLHSVQVVVILAATFVVLRAWTQKTAHEEALARMVEKVLFAQEEERRRIAYDVHDGIAQLIVSAKQHVDTCHDLWDRETGRAAGELVKGLDCLQRAIVETRQVLMALRPSALESIGLVEAIRHSLDEAAREAGWSVSLAQNIGDARLPPAVETAAFRILQEALANAQRHARAGAVAVDLRREEDWLTLEIRDQGAGFTVVNGHASSRGLGLRSMRERARLLGGTCTIESQPTRGTRISVRLPLEARGIRADAG